ncbi:type IV secretion system immunity protein Tsi7 [Uliginosibacterium flavum]|uniref:Uncharacterized protein n=1 Tax=Uliginosibacterium flavum TaxID=1396831 RepID=A0ABV2THZ1_9RHOO
MKSEFVGARTLIRGAARYGDLVYILSKGKELLERDIAHTSIIAVDQAEWAGGMNTVWDSNAIAVANTPSEKLVVIGEDGDVFTYVGGNSTEESILPPPTLIRNARAIEGKVFACGMKRQVYERVDEALWHDISAPLPTEGEEVGFEAIDGFFRNEIYAAGWNGEIWQFDGTRWHDRGSLTNRILTSVCCAQNGVVYIAGQSGLLIRGRNDAWEVVHWDEDTNVDIWDLCWFQDKLYVSTMSGLFTLEGKALVTVDFGGTAEPETFYSLTTAEGVLWSIGESDVASFDGQSWQVYE